MRKIEFLIFSKNPSSHDSHSPID